MPGRLHCDVHLGGLFHGMLERDDRLRCRQRDGCRSSGPNRPRATQAASVAHQTLARPPPGGRAGSATLCADLQQTCVNSLFLLFASRLGLHLTLQLQS